ncbi:hypothetical protein T459_30037 [Capsicum annuum]|uniref:Uncharacterized protein n=1 Tax=Capsicum annuum TaxID=4072 RepID=A0A2G2Y7B5_CAPAN|nr:hypothetical protein T459_30037 [Capsicum annuum]
MDHNDKNSQLRATLNDILGLERSDSLLHDKNSYDGYDDSPNRYLDSDDEDLQNLIDEEMNRSHQSDQDKYLSISDGEEYDHQEDDVDEEEGTIHDDSYTDNQYTAGPVVEKCKKDGWSNKICDIWMWCESMHAFFDGYIIGQSSLKQFVGKYEVALRFKYEKEMESQASKRKQLVRPATMFDWDIQIYGHYICAIYDFFRVHVARLPHCEIERHVDFDTVEGVEVLGDEVTDIMMYMMRIKAAKVGVAVADGVVEEVNGVVCVVVGEVEAMIQILEPLLKFFKFLHQRDREVRDKLTYLRRFSLRTKKLLPAPLIFHQDISHAAESSRIISCSNFYREVSGEIDGVGQEDPDDKQSIDFKMGFEEAKKFLSDSNYSSTNFGPLSYCSKDPLWPILLPPL